MELKIYCACGAKYKFDVEPVNGRMPHRVHCPVCGVEGAESANAILQQPVDASALATEPPPAAPVSTGLRIRPTESHAAAPAPQPVAPAPFPGNFSAPLPKKNVAGTLKTAFGLILAALVVLGLGFKWYRRISGITRTAITLGGGTSAEENFNLTLDDGVLMFVKHTNHMEVAQACGNFWTNKLSRGLSLLTTNSAPQWSERDYAVVAAHNGYVRIYGGRRWPEKEFDALSQFLSQTFNTIVVENEENDFSGAFVFAVYESGERKLFAKKTVKINTAKDDVDETVTVEGKEYALAQGFKPDPKDGWDDFDGEVITKRLGVKMWDEKEDAAVDFVLLKELRGAQSPGAGAGSGTNRLGRPQPLRATRTAAQ
jgi:hypothetical protein